MSKNLSQYVDQLSNALKVTPVDAAGNSTALPSTPKFAKFQTSASGQTQIVAAVASKKIRVIAYQFFVQAGVDVKFQSKESSTDITGLFYPNAHTNVHGQYLPVGHFETVAGEGLAINLSTAVATGGYLTYVEA